MWGSRVIRLFVQVCLLSWLALHPLQAQSVNDAAVQFDVKLPASDEELRKLQSSLALMAENVGGKRPTVVLDFQAADPNTSQDRNASVGQDVEFESALRLARFLTSSKATKLRTVAYVSHSISGHACLAALACEEFVIHSDSRFGAIPIGDENARRLITQAYRDVTDYRGRFPSAILDSMLDPNVGLFEIERLGRDREFVLRDQAIALGDEGKLKSSREIVIPGLAARFTGRELARMQLATVADNAETLKRVLQVDEIKNADRLLIDVTNPAVFEINGLFNRSRVNQLIRSIQDRVASGADLVIIDMNSTGGDFAATLKAAEFLASLPDSVLTVAWVSNQIAGASPILAMSCDRVYFGSNATGGGAGQGSLTESEVVEFRKPLEQLSKRTQRDEGILIGLCTTEAAVDGYVRAGSRPQWNLRVFQQVNPREPNGLEANEFEANELKANDLKDWVVSETLPNSEPVSSTWLASNRWISGVRDGLPAIASELGIETLPPPEQLTAIDRLVQRLADQWWISSLLLFVGFIALMNEFTAPGLGVAGFLSLLCFCGFFWLKFMDGTVEGLELVLFLVGVVAIGIEIFVVPGLGIFGVGGFFLILGSIVLASQTFIVPGNSLEMSKFLWNIWQPAMAILGLLVGLFLVRNHLEQLPFFRWLKLEGPTDEEQEMISQREAIVNWEHLQAAVGKTVTRCNPSGKAQFGSQVVDVVADGVMIDPGCAVQVRSVVGNRVEIALINHSNE